MPNWMFPNRGEPSDNPKRNPKLPIKTPKGKAAGTVKGKDQRSGKK